VPELASREHLKKISPIVDEACRQAGATLDDIEAIAVTEGPGLIGSLLVGLVYGKALALSLRKPLIGVNHLEGHIHAVLLHNTMERQAGKPVPAAGFRNTTLVVSGGHTILYSVDSETHTEGGGPSFSYKMLGRPETTRRVKLLTKWLSFWRLATRAARSSTSWPVTAILALPNSGASE